MMFLVQIVGIFKAFGRPQYAHDDLVQNRHISITLFFRVTEKRSLVNTFVVVGGPPRRPPLASADGIRQRFAGLQ
jgi:hypothetical protein